MINKTHNFRILISGIVDVTLHYPLRLSDLPNEANSLSRETPSLERLIAEL